MITIEEESTCWWRCGREKERCSGSYCQAVVFLVIKHDSISERPGYWQWGSRYTDHAGRNLPVKEFCYLRTNLLTAAVREEEERFVGPKELQHHSLSSSCFSLVVSFSSSWLSNPRLFHLFGRAVIFFHWSSWKCRLSLSLDHFENMSMASNFQDLKKPIFEEEKEREREEIGFPSISY